MFMIRCIGLGTPAELDDILLDLGVGVTRANVMQKIIDTPEFAPYAATLINGVPLVESSVDSSKDELKVGSYIIVMHRSLGMEGG